MRCEIPRTFKGIIQLEFFIPMPKSWSKKKRERMNLSFHQQVPDKDNLEKAFLDAICTNDAHIARSYSEKFWTEKKGDIILILWRDWDEFSRQTPRLRWAGKI